MPRLPQIVQVVQLECGKKVNGMTAHPAALPLKVNVMNDALDQLTSPELRS